MLPALSFLMYCPAGLVSSISKGAPL